MVLKIALGVIIGLFVHDCIDDIITTRRMIAFLKRRKEDE